MGGFYLKCFASTVISLPCSSALLGSSVDWTALKGFTLKDHTEYSHMFFSSFIVIKSSKVVDKIFKMIMKYKAVTLTQVPDSC